MTRNVLGYSSFTAASLFNKTLLKYVMVPVKQAVEFQILEQSDKITNFIYGLRDATFQASNGMRIGISDFPEFKDSENTIFLQGSNKKLDLKVDTTRFVSDNVRDKKIAMVKEALAELVRAAKANDELNGALNSAMAFVVSAPRTSVLHKSYSIPQDCIYYL